MIVVAVVAVFVVIVVVVVFVIFVVVVGVAVDVVAEGDLQRGSGFHDGV